MWVNPGNNRGATAVRCHHPPRSTRAGATRMARPHTMPSTRTHGRTESARRHPPANMPHLRPRLLLPHERAGHQLPTTHVLLNVVRHGTTTQNQTRITMTLTTRKPTGLPAWPILLIAGVPKAGKSYACAAASASPLVGRTLWVPVGEDDPDELGGDPRSRLRHRPTRRHIPGNPHRSTGLRNRTGRRRPARFARDRLDHATVLR